MLDARSQQIASAPHDAVHRVSLFQKQLAQIRAVLTGDPGNQRDFVGILFDSKRSSKESLLCPPPSANVKFLVAENFTVSLQEEAGASLGCRHFKILFA